jgi:DUF1680 family protein
VNLEVAPAEPVPFTLRLRIPGWCTAPTAKLNGDALELAAAKRGPDVRDKPRPTSGRVHDGYLYLTREWHAGDAVTLELPMPVQRMRANPALHHAAGCAALQRGPMVFCVEQADNGAGLSQLRLPKQAPLTARFDAKLLGGTVVIEGQAERVTATSDELYSTTEPASAPVALRAVPYCLWNNRGEGEMRVWIRES